MKRSLFLLGLAGATLTVTTLRIVFNRRARSRCGPGGSCANHRRSLRWSGFTAADFL